MKKPLAFTQRPTSIDEIVGQSHLLSEGTILRNFIDNKTIPSMIFFGPPGTGKTTTAMVLADALGVPYRLFNAVSDNKKVLDGLFLEAKMTKGGLILIVDEVHRLNKDKQDLLLPHVESGLITLIGATTANPYFSINPAIRSRVQLYEFQPLSQDNIIEILQRVETHKTIDQAVLDHLANASMGDARFALNALDVLINATKDDHITLEDLQRISISMNISMDKDGDNHFDLLSAFQKSIRGSDVNAALFYTAKLLEVGDFDSLERRLIVTAYEDIGLANPALCARVVQTLEAVRIIGPPESRILISNVVIECALSPKSKSANYAIDAARNAVRNSGDHVPKYLRLNPVGADPEEMYDYERSDLWHRIQYLPNSHKQAEFYKPLNLNSAEKTYAQNYEALKKYPRTSDLKSLKKRK